MRNPYHHIPKNNTKAELRSRKLLSIPLMIGSMVSLNSQTPVQAAEIAQVQTTSPKSSSTKQHASPQEMMVMFKKPATPRDLLENIKLGMEQNVFLREDFYTEDNIRQVLGNYPFRWETNDSKRKYLTIEPNAQPLPSSDSNHHCIFGSVLSWQIKAGSEAAPLVKQYLSLSLKHDDPRCAAFSADSMQNLFGKPAKIENIYPPIGPPNIHRVIVPGPATHPLGNTDIEYILDEGVVSKRLNLEIRGNGVVTQFHLSMEQK